MARNSRNFKDTQVYGWDAEPVDERPSEFVQSTGYSALSGYYAMPDVRGARGRPQKNGGLMFLMLTGSAITGLGIAGMYWLVQFLHG